MCVCMCVCVCVCVFERERGGERERESYYLFSKTVLVFGCHEKLLFVAVEN